MPFPRLSDALVSEATLAAIDREPRISADSHMMEPPDLWEKWHLVAKIAPGCHRPYPCGREDQSEEKNRRHAR